MSNSALDPNSFDAAFAVLEANAAKLRSTTGQIKIDDLLPTVEQSTEAYKICKDRLDRLRLALKKHLGEETGADGGDSGG